MKRTNKELRLRELLPIPTAGLQYKFSELDGLKYSLIHKFYPLYGGTVMASALKELYDGYILDAMKYSHPIIKAPKKG